MDKEKLAEEYKRIQGLVEKLSQDPKIKLFKDKEDLISTSVEKWNNPEIQAKIKEFETLSKSLALKSTLKETPEYSRVMKDLIENFEDKNYSKAQELLKQFPTNNYSLANTAIEQLLETINNPVIKNSALNFSDYESEILKVSQAMANNLNPLESSKYLANVGKQIASDSLKYKMEEQSKFNVPEFSKRIYEPIKMPENPVLRQNKQIIDLLGILKEQNETLIHFEKSDQDIQNGSITLMKQLQLNNEIMIQELKSQNSNIEKQLEELRKNNQNLEQQIVQKEQEITQNRKDSNFTRKIAIWGIGISIVVGIGSSVIPIGISYIENIENNQDNKKLLEAVNNKTNENENMSLLLKEMQLQNKINKNIEDNQIKLIKVIESQNEYLKKKDKK